VESLLDFLSFRSFVSPYALICFYYAGALGMPAAAWSLLIWLRRRYPLLGQAYDGGKQATAALTRPRYRFLLGGMFFFCFLFMELMWRMLFEYLIAFLQMRDALLLLQEAGGMP